MPLPLSTLPKWMATIRCAESQAPGKLTLLISGKGTGSARDFREGKGSSTARTTEKKGIPFIKIADPVDENFHRKGKRVGGPKE